MTIQLKLIAALLSVLALGAALLGYGHRQYELGVRHTTATYDAALQKQKADAATLLATETAKVLQINLALQQAAEKQELQDAKNQNTITRLADRLRAAAGPAGRLRDPFAAGCGGSGAGAPGAVTSATGDRADDAAETGGLLSAELTAFLQSRLQEADAINLAYTSCRADAYTVRRSQLPE